MEISSTFVPHLYTFHYSNEDSDELERVFDEWDDPVYLFDFFTDNKVDLKNNYTVEEAIEKTKTDLKHFRNKLLELESDPRKLNLFFQNLHNQEYKAKILSDQKAKQSWLRLYAIKIDDSEQPMFVITGGMIKLTHLMEDRPHGLIERNKIKRCKDFLKNNGVIDTDSFIEIFFEL